MKKIIVAGAGHGGLTAAILLARNGYDVTVYEKTKRENKGHDWHDCMTFGLMDSLGIERPDRNCYKPVPTIRYYPPSKEKVLWDGREYMNGVYAVDRKELYRKLFKAADESGVKLCFETDVLCAVFEKEKITGIKIKDKDGERTVSGDLIIDSAGMYSPVRQSLRQCCGIENCISSEDTFYVYRAYYENKSQEDTEYKYEVYLFHNNNPGMDWVISEDGFFDVLVGSFDPLDEKIINEAVDDFKRTYPFMGDKILRGGYCANIPLRNPLPKFVYDNYAAIGDCAGMTEPMSGSGIDLSMKAGKILAETVIAIGDGEFTTDTLWKYQYEYTKDTSWGYDNQNLRKTLEKIPAESIDGLINNEVITINEISSGGMKISSAGDAFKKVKGFIPHIGVLPGLVKMLYKGETIKKVTKILPEEYSEDEHKKWKELYKNI